MDLSKLTTSDRVIAGSGLALLVLSFFTWFEGQVGPIVVKSSSAWGFGFGIIGVLLGIVMVALVLLPAFGVELPARLRSNRAMLIFGCLAFATIVLVVLFAGYTVKGLPDSAVDTNRKVPAFVGLVAAAGLLVGAILRRKETAASPPPAAPPAPPAAPPA